MIEGNATTSPASKLEVRCGCGLVWPIFAVSLVPTRLACGAVPRTTDDAGGCEVVGRKVKQARCFEGAGRCTSLQVKTSVRRGERPSGNDVSSHPN